MPDALPGLERWPVYADKRRGRWLMFGDLRRSTSFADLDAWPPKPIKIETEYATSFDVLPDGRLVVCSMPTEPQGDYAVRIEPSGWPESRCGRPKVYAVPGKPGTCVVVTIGDAVVAFGSLVTRDGPPESHSAYLLRGGRFVPAPGLPPVRSFGRDRFGH